MALNAAELDLNSLARNFNTAARDMPTRMEEIRQRVAVVIFQEQLRLVPRKTSRLAASIRIKNTLGRTEIGPDGVPYAVYIEYGTGQFNEFGGSAYEIRPKTPGGTLAFDVGGKTIFTKRVIHPGIRPQPFIRPSLINALASLNADIANVHYKMLVGSAT